MSEEPSTQVGDTEPGAPDIHESLSADQALQIEMIKAINQIMPFGKHAGSRLLDLPLHYLGWFSREGFPNGKLGQQLALVYEIKHNGLDKVFRPLLRPADSSAEGRRPRSE